METIQATSQFSRKRLIFFWLGIIIVMVLVVFSPSLKNGFVNWDDTAHVLENSEIRGINATHIKTIFTSTATHGYIPLTIFSFALENHFFGLNPFVFHLDNLLLHLAVTLLIFFLALRLGLNISAAGLAALLFGIHPMHVESVAWVTARKDVLYSVFYLAALHSYWSYLEDGRKRFYAVTIAFGILSMLAKPMALSLPLVLWMLDGIRKRRFTPAVILEKLPYFLCVAVIGWFTYRFYPRVEMVSSWGEIILSWIWSLMFYPAKFFWPQDFFLAYEQPQPVHLLNWPYASAMIGLILTGLIVIRFRTHRWLIFAVLFYFCSIFFLLRGSIIENIPVADRYMYLPSVGFCFLFGYLVHQGWQYAQKVRWQKVIMSIVLIVMFGILSIKTFRQTEVWKNGLALWNHVLQYAPENNIARYSRGDVYKQMGQNHLALVDMTQGLQIMPNRDVEYFNRGTLFDDMGRHDWALKDYGAAIKLNPKYVKAYNNQAFIYFDRKQYQDAIAVLDRAIEVNPEFSDTFYNRGSVYAQMGDWDQALKDYDVALSLNPLSEVVYQSRSRVWSAKQEWGKALADVRQAQALGVKYSSEEMIALERKARKF